jgi:hypothetical protein
MHFLETFSLLNLPRFFEFSAILLILAYGQIEAFQRYESRSFTANRIVYFLSLFIFKDNEKTQLLVAASILLGYWIVQWLLFSSDLSRNLRPT